MRDRVRSRRKGTQPKALTAEAPRASLPRLPGIVADALRQQILYGEIAEGARLPKEEVLRERFGVGRPVMREAMRILESEGLLTVLRGNRGGALARKPRPQHTTYALSLLLSSRGVRTRDVGTALRELEPICAALCAQRPDRRAAVVPVLRKIHEASRQALEEPEKASTLFRSFHESIVALCGNQTLMVLVGALEAIWSENVRAAAARSTRQRSSKELDRSIRDHEAILHRIDQGDGRGVRRAVSDHISRVQAAATRANADKRIVLPMIRKSATAARRPRAADRDANRALPAWHAPAGLDLHDAGYPEILGDVTVHS